MPMILENWARLAVPGLRKIFSDAFQQQQSNLPFLFSMNVSEKSQELDLEDPGISDFAVMSGQIPYDTAVQGYVTTYTHEEYARGIKVERKLVDDDLYGIIERKPRRLAIAAARTRETSGANIFNDAFNASVVGGDAVSLCSASHPSLQNTSTQSNTGTATLSDVNVEATRRSMIAFRDSKENIIGINPDTLVVPVQLEQAAWEIINSKGKVDTAQNNANFHHGKYNLVVWPNYLSSATRWFMVDSMMMKEFLNWFDRIKPEFFRDSEFETQMQKFAGYMRYSVGWSDWRWVFGQNPS